MVETKIAAILEGGGVLMANLSLLEWVGLGMLVTLSTMLLCYFFMSSGK